MNDKKIEKLADLLVKANTDIGFGNSTAHGECHSYKLALSEEEIIAIIKSVLEAK